MSHFMSNLNIKIFIIGFIFLIGFNSTANSNSIEDIITKINTIENRIKGLEKATFNKTNSSQSNFNAGNYDSIITKQSIQISELQNQIQELTGSIEEVLLFNKSIIIDYLSSFMKVVTLLAAFFVLIISSNYLRTFKIFKIEYPILILSSVLGMMVMISSNDLIVFYMGLELQSLALYVLATFNPVSYTHLTLPTKA